MGEAEDDRVLCVLYEELEFMGASTEAKITATASLDRTRKALLGKFRAPTVKRYPAYWQGFRKWVVATYDMGSPRVKKSAVGGLPSCPGRRWHGGISPAVSICQWAKVLPGSRSLREASDGWHEGASAQSRGLREASEDLGIAEVRRHGAYEDGYDQVIRQESLCLVVPAGTSQGSATGNYVMTYQEAMSWRPVWTSSSGPSSTHSCQLYAISPGQSGWRLRWSLHLSLSPTSQPSFSSRWQFHGLWWRCHLMSLKTQPAIPACHRSPAGGLITCPPCPWSSSLASALSSIHPPRH